MRRTINFIVRNILGRYSRRAGRVIKLESESAIDASQQFKLHAADDDRKHRASLESALNSLKSQIKIPPQDLLDDTKSSPEQYFERANALFKGKFGVAADKNAAVQLWKIASEQGHENSKFSYASCLREGVGVPEDKAYAFKLFNELAARRHAGGTYSLALMLRAGEGCDKDEHKAFEYFALLAKSDITAAMHTVGVMLSNGEGCEKDENAAAHWFSQGSKRGDPLSTYALAGYTCAGKGGIAKDWAEGFRLHNEAANLGMPYAQFNMGCHYFSGHGVKQDFNEAAHWWELAANQNVTEAMLNLGKMHAQGLGVPKNEEVALEWYTKAVGPSEDSIDAKEAISVLMQKMNNMKSEK